MDTTIDSVLVEVITRVVVAVGQDIIVEMLWMTLRERLSVREIKVSELIFETVTSALVVVIVSRVSVIDENDILVSVVKMVDVDVAMVKVESVVVAPIVTVKEKSSKKVGTKDVSTKVWVVVVVVVPILVDVEVVVMRMVCV